MPSVPESTRKVARHRERMRSAGLRPVQFWVPDSRSPEFAAQLGEQCRAREPDACQGTPEPGSIE